MCKHEHLELVYSDDTNELQDTVYICSDCSKACFDVIDVTDEITDAIALSKIGDKLK